MKLRIEMDLNNSAFEHDPTSEVVRILEEMIVKMQVYPGEYRRLKDINGNVIGHLSVIG